MSTEISI